MAFQSCYHTPRHGLDFDDGRMFLTPCLVLRMFKQPKFWFAGLAALPCALLAAGLKYWQTYLDPDRQQATVVAPSAYAAMTFLVVFLMGFRVQAAYSKFWNGLDYAYGIIGDMWDGASSLFAFSLGAKADPQKIDEFQHLLVRLFSLQAALILSQLEKRTAHGGVADHHLKPIDIQGLDRACLAEVSSASCRVETTFQWIQLLIIQANQDNIFSVAPPILTRVFQDLGRSMQKFHEAEQLADVPFPLAYAMALQALLYAHWVLTFVMATSWSDYVVGASVFAFACIFCLWYFVGVSLELDRPYSSSPNSIDKHYLHQHFNDRLLTLLRLSEKRRHPKLSADYRQDISHGGTAGREMTLLEVLKSIEEEEMGDAFTRVSSPVSTETQDKLASVMPATTVGVSR